MIKTKLFIFIIVLFNSSLLFAYDAVIKDKYGNTTGYIDNDDDKTYILDKYGRRGDYIEEDGTIKDKYGNKKGEIEEND